VAVVTACLVANAGHSAGDTGSGGFSSGKHPQRLELSLQDRLRQSRTLSRRSQSGRARSSGVRSSQSAGPAPTEASAPTAARETVKALIVILARADYTSAAAAEVKCGEAGCGFLCSSKRQAPELKLGPTPGVVGAMRSSRCFVTLLVAE